MNPIEQKKLAVEVRVIVVSMSFVVIVIPLSSYIVNIDNLSILVNGLFVNYSVSHVHVLPQSVSRLCPSTVPSCTSYILFPVTMSSQSS